MFSSQPPLHTCRQNIVLKLSVVDRGHPVPFLFPRLRHHATPCKAYALHLPSQSPTWVANLSHASPPSLILLRANSLPPIGLRSDHRQYDAEEDGGRGAGRVPLRRVWDEGLGVHRLRLDDAETAEELGELLGMGGLKVNSLLR